MFGPLSNTSPAPTASRATSKHAHEIASGRLQQRSPVVTASLTGWTRRVGRVLLVAACVLVASGCTAAGTPGTQTSSIESAASESTQTQTQTQSTARATKPSSSAPVATQVVGPSDELSGSVWKGGNLYDDNVSFTFGTGGNCQLVSCAGSSLE